MWYEVTTKFQIAGVGTKLLTKIVEAADAITAIDVANKDVIQISVTRIVEVPPPPPPPVIAEPIL